MTTFKQNIIYIKRQIVYHLFLFLQRLLFIQCTLCVFLKSYQYSSSEMVVDYSFLEKWDI